MSDRIEELKLELEVAENNLVAQQIAYRLAKAKLKQAKIEAGVTSPDEAVVRLAREIEDKIPLFKTPVVREVLQAVADTFSHRNNSALLDLDDKLAPKSSVRRLGDLDDNSLFTFVREPGYLYKKVNDREITEIAFQTKDGWFLYEQHETISFNRKADVYKVL
jgi:hypothetical protein